MYFHLPGVDQQYRLADGVSLPALLSGRKLLFAMVCRSLLGVTFFAKVSNLQEHIWGMDHAVKHNPQIAVLVYGDLTKHDECRPEEDSYVFLDVSPSQNDPCLHVGK